MTTNAGGGKGPIAVVAVVVVLVGVIAAYLYKESTSAPALPEEVVAPEVNLGDVPEDPSGTAPAMERAPDAAPEAPTDAKPEDVEEPGDEAAAPAEEETASPVETATVAPAIAAPTFDDVRIEVDGLSVISGRAEPGLDLDIMLDNQPVTRLAIQPDGTFSGLLKIGASEQPRVLALLLDPEGRKIPSEVNYFVAPTAGAAPEAEIAVAESEEQPVDTAQTDIQAAEDTELAAAESNEAVLETSPTILAADASGVRVVQSGEADPVATENVTLDTISYNSDGAVTLAGRAPGEGVVQVYLDNSFVAAGEVAAGQWQTSMPDVAPGIYTLRIDQLGSDGAVLSRLETPFKREAPERIAQAMAQETSAPDFRVAVKTVQKGHTLWAIAEERYGDGIRYVEVFAANRDKIRDPDLIYPGQVFVLPEVEADGGAGQ